jgi:hypothetical protein
MTNTKAREVKYGGTNMSISTKDVLQVLVTEPVDVAELSQKQDWRWYPKSSNRRPIYDVDTR